MHKKFWSVSLREKYHPEEIDVDGKIILEPILGKEGEKLWAGCF
jgi:hypothetical protein